MLRTRTLALLALPALLLPLVPLQAQAHPDHQQVQSGPQTAPDHEHPHQGDHQH